MRHQHIGCFKACVFQSCAEVLNHFFQRLFFVGIIAEAVTRTVGIHDRIFLSESLIECFCGNRIVLNPHTRKPDDCVLSVLNAGAVNIDLVVRAVYKIEIACICIFVPVIMIRYNAENPQSCNREDKCTGNGNHAVTENMRFFRVEL